MSEQERHFDIRQAIEDLDALYRSWQSRRLGNLTESQRFRKPYEDLRDFLIQMMPRPAEEFSAESMDRKQFGRIAQQAEARLLRGGWGEYPKGMAYVLVVHHPHTGLTVQASNLEPAMVADLLDEVAFNIRTG